MHPSHGRIGLGRRSERRGAPADNHATKLLLSSSVASSITVVGEFDDLADFWVLAGETINPIIFGDVFDLVFGLLARFIFVVGFEIEVVGLLDMTGYDYAIGWHHSFCWGGVDPAY